MLGFIETFRADEDGVVTVDWVVLCGLVVGVLIATVGVIFPASRDTASLIDDEITSLEMNTTLVAD